MRPDMQLLRPGMAFARLCGEPCGCGSLPAPSAKVDAARSRMVTEDAMSRSKCRGPGDMEARQSEYRYHGTLRKIAARRRQKRQHSGA